MKKGQVIFIHGGDSFSSNEAFYEYLKKQEYNPNPEPYKRWRDDVQDTLEAEGYEWLFMSMPNKLNADYEAWKIWFEKAVPFISDDTTTQVIGYSLGACFLLRYLSENKAPFTIDKLHLISPILEVVDTGDDLGSFVTNRSLLPSMKDNASEIHVYHSKDDYICPYAHSEQIIEDVDGELHSFTDRNHFLQPEFPEILEEIRK